MAARVLPAIRRSWMAAAGWASAILAAETAVFVVYHLWHTAYMPAGASLVLGLLAAFVAWEGLNKRAPGFARLRKSA